eukprot:11162385-Lingulodinium_polyedra.AAC.1
MRSASPGYCVDPCAPPARRRQTRDAALTERSVGMGRHSRPSSESHGLALAVSWSRLRNLPLRRSRQATR